MSKFAKELKAARIIMGVSTREAEDAVRIGNGSISRYERDLAKPSFETVVKLARYYDYDLDDLAWVI